MIVAGVASIAAGVLLFRRRRAQQQVDLANQDRSGGEERSGPVEHGGGRAPTRPVEGSDASDAATAPLPVFISAPDLATEPTEP